tara:strand:+ start:1571 stop:5017 length:3447 start_codon:yes stop_codon:yes gene_type:complete
MNSIKKSVIIGLDVGSTTVKAVVIDSETEKIIWKDYQYHETNQPEKVYEFLSRIEQETGLDPKLFRIFCTGSGSNILAPVLGARFVQEVNAVSLAVRKLHPEVRSVIELGGQDAKIIVFREDAKTGNITTIPSMNDKCASGTGATIEKIAKKVGTSLEELGKKEYFPYVDNLVHIAAKCGVFAETDVVGHLKSGLPEDQIMASLFDSIVTQNISVLTRGNTLRPKVLLLGGPNTYIKGMLQAWIHNIPQMWEDRGVKIPEGTKIEDHIVVPDNAEYYAAIGAVEFALEEGGDVIECAKYLGKDKLKNYIEIDRHLNKKGSQGLWKDKEELSNFLEKYTPLKFKPLKFKKGDVVRVFLGIDSGSTSTKAVLIDDKGEVVQKEYKLSDGNPIQDSKDCVRKLRDYVESFGASLEILGMGTTGYAKDILAEVFSADVALVETVAHTMAAKNYYPGVDVICDVGGQDIKIIMLQNGRVSDFRLNTQCSAGNGYFLQSTATALGVKVEDYANVAFNATRMPVFGYGCAVFMQSDIVNFQKEGWTSEEIMAGLANVLPKNIWLYVSKIPNLASLGKTFVLQGGTQYNLAAVKAQVDFIQERFENKGVSVDIHVHKHCGEAGAIGCAMEAVRLYKNGKTTSFIGIEQLLNVNYIKNNDERTRCYSCKNKCPRTFIDVKVKDAEPLPYKSKVSLKKGHKRIITGFSCDRGTVENVKDIISINKKMISTMKENPNLVADMALKAFQCENVNSVVPNDLMNKLLFRNIRKNRKSFRIGIPKVLNMYSLAPFFNGYFRALGIEQNNLVFSPTTNEKMYKEGAKRGSIDPCFPSKVAIPHVHYLLQQHKNKNNNPLDVIFFPMIDSFPSHLKNIKSPKACPTVCATPAATKAAFIKEKDIFKENNIKFLNPLLNLDKPGLLARQMFDTFQILLNLNKKENNFAVNEGLKCLRKFDSAFRKKGKEVLEKLEKEKRVGFVVLARPYHNDDGINHEILLKIQRLGYPILSQDSLPNDKDTLEKVFEDDIKNKRIDNPLEIKDVWTTSFSENTSRKIWAAKFIARHPNLVALELSNFKCGHDAPPYTVIENILSNSKTLFFTFRDLDENTPGGAIKIRLETINYFLKLEEEKLRGIGSAGALKMNEKLEDHLKPGKKLCSIPKK